MCNPVRHSIVIAGLLLLAACANNDASLYEVDNLINRHQTVQAQYQERLDSLHAAHPFDQMTDIARFDWYGKFFDMYRGFDIDSQMLYGMKRVELATRLSAPMHMRLAQMNQAEVLMRYGMYHEALSVLAEAASSPVEHALRPYYYHLCRTIYGLLEDFAIAEPARLSYHQLTQVYRDSIMQVEPEGSFVHELVRADALYEDGQYIEALSVMDAYEASDSLESDQAGSMAITKAQIYRAIGDHDAEKNYLIVSACSDLRSARREYIALRDLAVLLYKEGDFDRAHAYIHCCIEDAEAGGVRSRSLEISTVYPIIEGAYQRQETVRKRMLYGLIASIALLAGMLSLFLIYSAHTNRNLKQSNHIITVYVGHYMEMASMLIDRFDNWRKELNQHAKAGEVKRLQSEVASQRFTQEQVSALYHDFDEAFLAIFPDFVEEVKALLVDGTEFNIKPGERLNTDLRVLCCIRLGITDSKKIASFLRYSLSTIYNSRTRMRNLAKGNRDEFEQKIATS